VSPNVSPIAFATLRVRPQSSCRHREPRELAGRSGAPRAARASHRRRRRLGAGDSLSRIMGQLGAPRSPVPLAVLLVIGLECARHASIV